MREVRLTHSSRWRMLRAGIVAAFVASAVIFLVLRMLPGQAYPVSTLLAVATAFGVGYRLTMHYRQTLVAWLLASVVIPAAYILGAQLILLDAQGGWGALAYLFGTACPVLGGNVGVATGLMVRKIQDMPDRSDR